MAVVIEELDRELDPGAAYKGKPYDKNKHSKLQLENYRLCPTDGVLEFRVILGQGILWLPMIPASSCGILVDKDVTWRKWLFDHARCIFVNPHRNESETFQALRRMAYWDSMAKDCERYYASCRVRWKFHSHAVQAPFRSPLADEAGASTLPWTDAIID